MQIIGKLKVFSSAQGMPREEQESVHWEWWAGRGSLPRVPNSVVCSSRVGA